jgi:TRAP-type C4-dicarboxylate transport system permease small subunit
MRRVLRAAADVFALAGGALVMLVAVVTVISVLARWIAASPVPGDVELVQLGIAVALALFLPYCQLHGGHLIVDIFTARADIRVHRRLEAVAHYAAAAVLALLATRATVAVADLRAAGETSMVLGVPLWVAYMPVVLALALAALIALVFPSEVRVRGAA